MSLIEGLPTSGGASEKSPQSHSANLFGEVNIFRGGPRMSVKRELCDNVIDHELCAICMEPTWRHDALISELELCSHRFHATCIDRYTTLTAPLGRSPTGALAFLCPLCREPF